MTIKQVITEGARRGQSRSERIRGTRARANNWSTSPSFRSSASMSPRCLTCTPASADLAEQNQGVVCRKDKGVVDDIPSAYKDIDEVMANQSDLVEVMHTLKQVVCVKG